MRTVMCSGGFDPLTIGHLRYLQEASRLGNVVIALNSDRWLIRKKGYVFMPWYDREEILRGLACVRLVGPVLDDDGTICAALRTNRVDIFANGGDRTEANPAEGAVCEELGVEQIFNVGGGKIASSSELVRMAFDYHQNPVPR